MTHRYGALLGATGQGARVIVGIKKLNDTASAQNTTISSGLVPSQLVTSLLIGAVAGIIGVVSTGMDFTNDIAPKDVVTLMFIGYAGTDFIEGFIRREKPAELPTAGAGPVIARPTLTPGPQITLPGSGGASDNAVG